MGPQKFIAANTADALKLIRTELGSDAMVLSTKDTDQGVEIIAITIVVVANIHVVIVTLVIIVDSWHETKLVAVSTTAFVINATEPTKT